MTYRYSARYRTWYRPSRGSVPRPVAVVAGAALAAGMASGVGQVTHHHHHSQPAVTAPAGGNVALGQQMAAQAGWTGAQWNCLDWLWNRESGWSRTAENAKSGAYGIAQALGHGPTNQYPAGPANPPTSSAPAQIEWGLRYIANTPYGTHTPCQAWDHEQNNGWY